MLHPFASINWSNTALNEHLKKSPSQMFSYPAPPCQPLYFVTIDYIPGPSCRGVQWTTPHYRPFGFQTGHPDRRVQVYITLYHCSFMFAPGHFIFAEPSFRTRPPQRRSVVSPRAPVVPSSLWLTCPGKVELKLIPCAANKNAIDTCRKLRGDLSREYIQCGLFLF